MTIVPQDFPYEAQQGEWMCGAAALCMVYRSLGQDARQREVWQSISSKNRSGVLIGRARLMCQDAWSRGLSAVLLQAKDLWLALSDCLANDVRVILRHRFDLKSSAWHFSLVVGIDCDRALLHDPRVGPLRPMNRTEIQALAWPRQDFRHGLWSTDQELGNIIVAFRHAEEETNCCPSCGQQIPEAIGCPRCDCRIPLRPAAALGCADDGNGLGLPFGLCPTRRWQAVLCPFCATRLTYVTGLATSPSTEGADE